MANARAWADHKFDESTCINECLIAHIAIEQEAELAALRLQLQAAKGRGDALQAFKDFVHRRLDTAKVPYQPEPPKHALEECRIGDRLDWLEDQLRAAQEEIAELKKDNEFNKADADSWRRWRKDMQEAGRIK